MRHSSSLWHGSTVRRGGCTPLAWPPSTLRCVDLRRPEEDMARRSALLLLRLRPASLGVCYFILPAWHSVRVSLVTIHCVCVSRRCLPLVIYSDSRVSVLRYCFKDRPGCRPSTFFATDRFNVKRSLGYSWWRAFFFVLLFGFTGHQLFLSSAQYAVNKCFADIPSDSRTSGRQHQTSGTLCLWLWHGSKSPTCVSVDLFMCQSASMSYLVALCVSLNH